MPGTHRLPPLTTAVCRYPQLPVMQPRAACSRPFRRPTVRGLSVGLRSAKCPARSWRSPPCHTPRLNWPTVYRCCQSRFDGCIRGSDGHRNISSGSNCSGITVDRLSKSSSASLPIANVAGYVAAAACISSRHEATLLSSRVERARCQ